MKFLSAIALIACALPLVLWGELSPEQKAQLPQPANRPVDFVKDIQPLFEAACVKCHAKGKDKGGFSLETRERFLKGGDTGSAAVAGKSADSYLIELVTSSASDEVMPKKGTKWTPEQVGLMRAWIDQGAAWPANVTFAKPPPENLHPRTVALARGRRTSSDRQTARALFRRARYHARAVGRGPCFCPPCVSRSHRPAALVRATRGLAHRYGA